MLKFAEAVRNFFQNSASLNKANKRLLECYNFYTEIYAQAAKFTKGLPLLHLYYASSGVWKSDPLLAEIIEGTEASFKESNLFASTKLTPIDAARLQKMYFASKNAIRAEIEFPVSVSMPEIDNIREAYIGAISVSEYLKLVVDENGDIIKKVFFDNLRDYQGDTEVNKAIASTLTSGRGSLFPILNNGVTVVARHLNRIGNRFIVEDYQIVNGCQTSHVLASNLSAIDDKMYCPIKIVNTDHEDSIREIVISSNRQNEIISDSFWILDDIHKNIEVFFEQRASDGRLYYERRSGQYKRLIPLDKAHTIS